MRCRAWSKNAAMNSKRSSRLCFFLLLGLLTMSGCASYQQTKGVRNTWRDPSLPAIEVGKTTQSDILAHLGPPSQVIALGDQTVFYYLMERGKGGGAILIVFNWLKQEITYDRAIFFFDSHGVLQDYGFSREAIPYSS